MITKSAENLGILPGLSSSLPWPTSIASMWWVLKKNEQPPDKEPTLTKAKSPDDIMQMSSNEGQFYYENEELGPRKKL